jgi:hypothetical protein
MPKFPSVEWFKAVGREAGADKERFKRLGYVDADVGIQIDGDGRETRRYLLRFRDYGIDSVEEAADLAQADFTLDGSLEAWTDMVQNIAENGGADIDHTLNRLTMAGVPLRVIGADQLKTDIFYRFNQSFQEFFNEAAAVTTEFPPIPERRYEPR